MSDPMTLLLQQEAESRRIHEYCVKQREQLAVQRTQLAEQRDAMQEQRDRREDHRLAWESVQVDFARIRQALRFRYP